MDADVLRRFEAKVDRSGDCWLWTAAKQSRGYGVLRIQGKNRLAHVLAWEHSNGLVPDGQRVLHRCDNRPCVRAPHLFLGTDADNTMDMLRKGRHLRRDDWRNGYAWLTDDEVREIRRRYRHHCAINGANALSREFSVGPNTILAVAKHQTHRHVA